MAHGPLKILIVDDEPSVGHALQVLFDIHGLPCSVISSPREALECVDAGGVGVVIQDMNFGEEKTSGDEGIRLFRGIRARDAELPIVLITAWASLETAVQLIKEGANDYMAKPWDNDKLVLTVRNLLEMRRLQLENSRLQERSRREREELARTHDLCGLVYESEALHRVVTLAVGVAASDAPVLVTGPSGAGKEKLAEIVQANSRRRDRPFQRVNVGAVPEELMESELFGAEAGAYTGATGLRVGHFEAADRGTLFLDEIDALSLNGQIKLLRVAQNGEYQRLGSSKTRRSDVRIISATNTDLGQAVSEGRFREDLYYRLNVIELPVPPLSERTEDIVLLARHFLSQDETADGDPPELSDAARTALLRHRWNGNVRELQNRIQRALLTHRGAAIDVSDLDLDAASPVPGRLDSPIPSSGPLADERRRIEHALTGADGVVARAAEQLGLSRQALYRKMNKLGIVLERRPRT